MHLVKKKNPSVQRIHTRSGSLPLHSITKIEIMTLVDQKSIGADFTVDF